ncbi:uncharacterized protein HMPREF1541_03883 [Cyphellophora europaea CBS 101466]|uniref:Mercuric reductase n=1 Tax=Cyphellophora europaea (strain CBS 101466) TaxID=1220924 RepID=W2S1X1_CYPE1|nr:uncharacterized protein HMPREF1541_03883 [Cyphellophora europaea CBS 101466]ETN41944.1 hypothetical protein HMPREF1541_03883 [Cyphellophora europaea CBS 101466]
MATNSEDPDHYGALVIGSGQGGTPLTMSLAKAGHRTLLIEATHIGGTCINEGCTPTKTMVSSARIAALTTRGPDYGVRYKRSSLALDMETVRKRKRDIVDSFRSGGESRLTNQDNVEILFGRARFVGERTVEVTRKDGNGSGNGNDGTKRTVKADRVFVNVGCRPAGLQAKNADKVACLDSTSIMELGEVPRHLVVVGGGYVGIEFAQMFRRFGAKVSVVQRGKRLLPREDEDVSDAVRKILTEDGVEIFTEAETKEISNVPTGQIVLGVGLPGGNVKTLLCSHVLVAGGRVPNTTDLDCDAAGIQLDERGFIKVNGELETSADNVWALGDVKGGPQFTHVSYDDFRILEHNLVTSRNSKPKSTEGRLVPYTVFMDPQLGRVGLTLAAAQHVFPQRKLQVAKMPMEWVARALETAETRGFMKAVVDEETREILGFACLGIEGGEVMSQVQIAMMGGLTYDKLRDGIFAHPCLSEALNNLWGTLEKA